MSQTLSESLPAQRLGPAAAIRFARVGIIFAFSAALLAYVILSWHWPLVWDMQVMHYVSFLIDRGFAPYRQISDMNMPGAYLFEGWALHLFGNSDLGWRLYDFSLCAVLLASMISIARRYDWLAGFVAGGTFILVHAAEGPHNAGQREQEITVLLLLGTALCFEAVRQRRPWLMFPFGLATAMAATIKPTLILVGPAVLVLVLIHHHREKLRSLAYTLWSLAGFALATIIVLHFLLAHGSMQAFVFDLTRVIPHYASVNQATWPFLLAATLPRTLFIYIGIAVLLALLDRNCFNWEIAALLIGLFFGLVSFYGQHKGFGQHRYPEMAFALLWASIQVFASARGHRRSAQLLACAALLIIVFLNIPRDLIQTGRQPTSDPFSHYLEHDLQTIGVAPLQHKVQCLDVVDGCLTALFHLQLVESNGATGDLLLFLPENSWTVTWTRDHYWAEIQQNPPSAFILTNREFSLERNFDKIDRWPLFAAFLRQNYEVVLQRDFGPGPPLTTFGLSREDPEDPAYRIYLRKGSPILATARQRLSPPR